MVCNLTYQEIKKIYEVISMFEIPVEYEGLKEKLRLLVMQINLMEETQSKLGELQEKIVALNKENKDEVTKEEI